MGSVSPYSKFEVGAALLTKHGEIIGGANVESASYGLTCCAERIALFKALTDGKKDFVAIAVVARWKNGPMPCGAACAASAVVKAVIARDGPGWLVIMSACTRFKAGPPPSVKWNCLDRFARYPGTAAAPRRNRTDSRTVNHLGR